MEKVHKVVLLSDDETSRGGLLFLNAIENAFRMRGIIVWHQRILIKKNIAEAIDQYDRITLELKPDLLIVADFACIKMQSEQEEPFYNNLEIPVIHLLFRRPWEYEVFMVWRCNFTTRCYCMLEEDAEYVRRYYPRIPNVLWLNPQIWNLDVKIVCCLNGTSYSMLVKKCEELPEYLKTIQVYWWKEKARNPVGSDAWAMRECLKKIGFECSEEEFLNVMYLAQPIISLYYLEMNSGDLEKEAVIFMRADALNSQMDEFLQLDFKISLL